MRLTKKLFCNYTRSAACRHAPLTATSQGFDQLLDHTHAAYCKYVAEDSHIDLFEGIPITVEEIEAAMAGQ